MMPENQQGNSPVVLRRVTGEDGAPRLILAGKYTLAALGQRIQPLSAELDSVRGRSGITVGFDRNRTNG